MSVKTQHVTSTEPTVNAPLAVIEVGWEMVSATNHAMLMHVILMPLTVNAAPAVIGLG
jgi:hypothetical protein